MRDSFTHTSGTGGKNLDQRILELFHAKKGGVVSGEEFSRVLEVSRTAVWKHIKSLKDLGYQIVAVPSQGYRLVTSPDILIPAEIAAGLTVTRIGRRIICFRETDSTNEVAFRLAEEGVEEGTVVIAEKQRRGKGRLGRRWESPAGVNLYCSVVLRPPILPMQAAQLTFLSTVAVARAVAETAALRPFIKWPNDVLINGMKVAGLLNEMSAETEKVNFVVLGIGVNINMQRTQFPDDLRHPATSLALEAGKDVSRLYFTRNLLKTLDELYDSYLARGYAPVREEWLARCDICGRKVKVSFQESGITGVAVGIDDYGALLLQLPDGRVEKVLAGDVTIL
ncbi:MAG: BirA family transcriptional regulator biotin operon repressor / biotin-acetyl-CoA-carboxylase [Geobacteraceae bacterium]|nr:MAG: BirA family transcriptional regulator biotin operon repressor / biotin-acetyl-CoA-carboxylase [Geobacteraceae bacterium]